MGKEASKPTLFDELDRAKSHYSKSLSDVDFFRIELHQTPSDESKIDKRTEFVVKSCNLVEGL